MLSVVMLINRSGTMVLPFLSVYLTTRLGFSIEDAGYILSFYGLGAMAGAFLGGYLSDKLGHFYIQFFSLVLAGLGFILLSAITAFYSLLVGVFVLSLISESLRPANASSISFYSRPENISRSFSLNRMAINLGFSIGPAAGGLLAAISYRFLFLADGLTCIAAGLFFFFYFRTRKGYEPRKQSHEYPKVSRLLVFRDKKYLLFILLTIGFATLFFQLFIALPLYYRNVYALSEGKIGGLLAMNGLIVFSLEMILVYILNRRYRMNHLVLTGLIIMGISFALLNSYHGTSVLIMAMLLLSISEIFAMPFMATWVVQVSSQTNRGAYMGLYTFAFAVANVIGPFYATQMIENFGFPVLWWTTAICSLLIGIGFWWILHPGRPGISGAA